MALIEALTTGLCAAILKSATHHWLKDTPVVGDAANSVVDSLKRRFEDFQTRRQADRLLQALQDEVATKLCTFIETEFSTLSENEQIAAAFAVQEIFESTEVTSEAVGADLDALKLERTLLADVSDAFSQLDQNTASLAQLLLRESCNYVITLVDQLPDYRLKSTQEQFRRFTGLHEQLKAALDKLEAMRMHQIESSDRSVVTFETEYRRSIVHKYDRVELFGLRMVGAGIREYGLSIAYVTLSSTSGINRTQSAIDECLSSRKLVIIRGEAGSGKTTLLQWLAVRAASGDFDGRLASWNARLPFYVRLRDHIDSPFPLPSEMVRGCTPEAHDLMPDGWAYRSLKAGAIVLVDGIDEIPSSRRVALFTWIRGLKEQFPESLIVLSSRPAAVDASLDGSGTLAERLAANGFDAVTLEPMQLQECERLVSQWHSAVATALHSEEQREQLRAWEARLIQDLRERPIICALASTPLLCAVICALNWDRKRRLPDHRMELYRQALDMLLETRDAERGVPDDRAKLIDKTAKEELLGSLAYWMLTNNYSEVKREDAEAHLREPMDRLPARVLDTGVVLQWLLERSGVLRQPQHGVVDFIHRTFLEYLAARSAVNRSNRGVLVQRAQDESWRETIVFAAGHAQGNDRDRLIEELLGRGKIFGLGPRSLEMDVTLACCLESVDRNIRNDLLNQMHERARRLFPPDSLTMARTLAPVAALEPDLLKGHNRAPMHVIVACIRAAALAGRAVMIDVIESYARTDGVDAEIEVLRAWPSFDEIEYRDRVIRARRSVAGVNISNLDNDSLSVLYFLTVRAGVPHRTIQALLNAFMSDRSLDLDEANQWRSSVRLASLSVRDSQRLAALGSLRKLRVCDLAQGALAPLRDCEDLTSLSMHRFDPIELRALATFPSLQSLTLRVADGISLVPLASSPSISSLKLGFSAPPADLRALGLGALSHRITRLSIESQVVELQCAAELKRLAALRVVDPPNDLDLTMFRQLEEIELMYPRSGLPDVRVRLPFTHLRQVRISNAGEVEIANVGQICERGLHVSLVNVGRLVPWSGSGTLGVSYSSS